MPTHPDSRAKAPSREKIGCLSVGDMRAPLCDFHAETTPPGAPSTRVGEAPMAPSAIHAGGDAPSMNQDAHSVKHSLLTVQSHPPRRGGVRRFRRPSQVDDGPASPRNRREPSPRGEGAPLPLSRARRPFPAVLRPSSGHVTPATRLNPPHSPPRFVGPAGTLHIPQQCFHSKFQRWQGWQRGGSTTCHLFLLSFQQLISWWQWWQSFFRHPYVTRAHI